MASNPQDEVNKVQREIEKLTQKKDEVQRSIARLEQEKNKLEEGILKHKNELAALKKDLDLYLEKNK